MIKIISFLLTLFTCKNYEDSSFFPHDNFLEISFSNINYCYKSYCFQNQEICIYRNENQKILKYSNCPEGYKCQILQDLSGKCVFNKDENDKITYEIRNLFPGDYCGNPKIDRCVYGPQKCSNGICLGFKENENCFISSDCDLGLYCSNGICSQIKKVGENCLVDEECGRNSTCLYKQFNKGICVEFFTIKNGSNVNVFNIVNSNGNTVKGKYSNLLCQSGIADEKGFCNQGYKSSTKGKECKYDDDCKNDIGILSKCKCSLNDNGKKYCDLFNGDEEFLLMREKFKLYFISTLNCHGSQKFGECNEEKLYKDFKCAEFKAKNYLYLQRSNLKCLNINKRVDLFIFKDYFKYCTFIKIFLINILNLYIFF